MKYKLTEQLEIHDARTYLELLINEGANIEIKKIIAKRTLKQNAYFHVVISIFAISSGYTIEESKQILKEMYGNIEPSMRYRKGPNEFLKSTTQMNTKELTDFIDWIRNYAAKKAGIYIPTSEEYLINQFAINKDIDRNKQYL
jgi:hypothetical protein